MALECALMPASPAEASDMNVMVVQIEAGDFLELLAQLSVGGKGLARRRISYLNEARSAIADSVHCALHYVRWEGREFTRI
jgi:hypothetical protein